MVEVCWPLPMHHRLIIYNNFLDTVRLDLIFYHVSGQVNLKTINNINRWIKLCFAMVSQFAFTWSFPFFIINKKCYSCISVTSMSGRYHWQLGMKFQKTKGQIWKILLNNSNYTNKNKIVLILPLRNVVYKFLYLKYSYLFMPSCKSSSHYGNITEYYLWVSNEIQLYSTFQCKSFYKFLLFFFLLL